MNKPYPDYAPAGDQYLRTIENYLKSSAEKVGNVSSTDTNRAKVIAS